MDRTMGVPASEVQALIEELGDVTRRPHELALRSLAVRVESLWRKGLLPEDLNLRLRASLATRKGDFAEAARIWRLLVAREPENEHYLNNLAVALIQAGSSDLDEIIDLLVTASEQKGGYNVGVLSNLAEAFALAGAWAQAKEIFEADLEIADLGNVDHLWRLADAAGAIGQYDAAVELFARFVSLRRGGPAIASLDDALDLIQGIENEWWADVAVGRSVLTAIDRAQSLRASASALREERNSDATAADDVLEMLEATRPLRSAATRAVIRRD